MANFSQRNVIAGREIEPTATQRCETTTSVAENRICCRFHTFVPCVDDVDVSGDKRSSSITNDCSVFVSLSFVACFKEFVKKSSHKRKCISKDFKKYLKFKKIDY